MTKKIILTGAQGTGKTSLLNSFKGKYCTVNEASRKIIIQQQQLGTNITPWGNAKEYNKLVFRQMISDYHIHKSPICFFDRALPDVMAYFKFNHLQVPDYYLHAVKKYLSNSIVFFFPVWESIYKNDKQRLESVADAYTIGKHIRTTYEDLGFNIIEVPKDTVANRQKFILKKLTEYNFL